jgi:outer membrane receptor protein involved in Fe transport
MSKIYKYCIALMFFLTSITFAQTYSISGKVTNSQNGDILIGANVYIAALSNGAVTNTEGFFTITKVPAGTYTVKASFVGFESVETEITVDGDEVLNVSLTPSSVLLENVVVEVNRGKERETPATFTTLSREELRQEYTTGDVPDLLKKVPGVFTSSNGLGDASIFIRGFDAEHIQIMINGVPTNDPESQVVYWSNWTGLSSNASSIQVQRGVGVSLVGSGSFGGSVNINTSEYSSQMKVIARGSTGFYTTQGVSGGELDGKNADGTGGYQNYSPANQNFAFEFTSGQLYDGKLNIFLSYERKAGDSYVDGTYYNGHSFYAGIQSILGNHLLTFNFIGAPQRHNQARTSQDMQLMPILGREYNRNNTPYQENYYFKPQYELHWDWNIAEQQNLNTNAFITTGDGGGRYLRNDVFDVSNGEIRRKDVSIFNDWKEFGRNARFIYENTGVVLSGYDPASMVYEYGGISDTVTKARVLTASQFGHSWRNDSQNNHTQFGINSAYSQRVADIFGFVIGGEARNWRAQHTAQSFDFSYSDLNDDGTTRFLNEVQRRYNYDGVVNNFSGFARLLLYPVSSITVMLDAQYAVSDQSVEENKVRIFDYGLGQWTDKYFLATKDIKNSDGTSKFADSDYERTFNFFQPKAGVNWNINDNWNVYGNYGIAKKEPKVGDWYSRSSGPGTNQPVDDNGKPIDLIEETLKSLEFGVGYNSQYLNVTANYFNSKFEDKIESVTEQNGDRATLNAGNATHSGFELSAAGRYKGWDASLSVTASSNTWDEMNVSKIFGVDAEDVVGKVVPFAPENIYHAGIGYTFSGLRLGLEASKWDRYYGNYDNTAVLPNFFSLNAVVQYGFILAGSRIDLRLNANNILGREQFQNANWGRDFNRNDALAGQFYMYVQQSPLQNYFFTVTVTVL